MRLFDYTVDMRSVNHNGVSFDTLSFSNFGYGGDPNDVSRLHIEKNKWFDFRAQFPPGQKLLELQPAGKSSESGEFASGRPDSRFSATLNLSRRMQDYDLTFCPSHVSAFVSAIPTMPTRALLPQQSKAAPSRAFNNGSQLQPIPSVWA